MTNLRKLLLKLQVVVFFPDGVENLSVYSYNFCNYDVEYKSIEINLSTLLIGCNWRSSILIATVMLTMALCLQIAEEISRLD